MEIGDATLALPTWLFSVDSSYTSSFDSSLNTFIDDLLFEYPLQKPDPTFENIFDSFSYPASYDVENFFSEQSSAISVSDAAIASPEEAVHKEFGTQPAENAYIDPEPSDSVTSSSPVTAKNAAKSAGRKLRTAARKSSTLKSNVSKRKNKSPNEVRASSNHNEVEKRYRNRLNAQYEQLVSVLQSSAEDSGEESLDSRLSKQDVLDSARRRILSLEKTKSALRLEQEQLRCEISRLEASRQ